MADRRPMGAMGRRLLTALLLVSMTGIAVHAVGTVIPHLTATEGHEDPVSAEWLLAATALAALVAAAVSVIVARRVVGPMDELIGAANAFAVGDHGVRLPDLHRPELAELVEALNAAAAEVERSEQARRHLSADIAHELRTPLTALQAGLEELRDGLVEPDRGTLASLHDQAARLSRLVNDLGELSAAEASGLQLSIGRVDLARVAELALTAHESSLLAAGLEVRRDISMGLVVDGDIDRLHQIVGNLLANARLYCRPGDEVTVRVQAVADRAVIEIGDTGPGFADDELDRAFDRSWRGSAATGTAGSGLGLAIVRALVLAQGGTVEIASERGVGTTVRVSFPRTGPGDDGEAQRTSQPRPREADAGGDGDGTASASVNGPASGTFLRSPASSSTPLGKAERAT